MTLSAISTTVTEILLLAAIAATSNPIYPAPITTRSLLIFRFSFIDSASSIPLDSESIQDHFPENLNALLYCQ